MTYHLGRMLSHYRLLEAIGEGGMGVVYRAYDNRLDRQVAIKVLQPELMTDPERRRRFKREARAAAAINHPSIATIYEVDEAEGSTFIVMELVEGKSLRALIRERLFPVSEALRIGAEIVEGLACAHQARIIHRDLKPENIIVRPDSHPKILDFGVAKLLRGPEEISRSRMEHASTTLTAEGRVLGTVGYMSPEQARGEPIDARSDIFAFGVTLYEMITGKAPFRGRTPTDTISAILRDEPPPASTLNPEVPQEVDRILVRCLQKDSLLRYQHAEEILQALERARDDRPSARRASHGRQLPLRLALLVLAIAATSVVLFYWPADGVPRLERISVAILPYANQSDRNDLDWLRTGLAENLATDLGQSAYLRVLTRERLRQILKEMGKAEHDSLDQETLSGIGEYGGVQVVLAGSFISVGETVRINLQAKDTGSGEAIGSVAVRGHKSEILALIDQMTVRTKRILGIPKAAIAVDVDRTIASTRTSSLRAATLFQQGVDLLYEGESLQAIKPLEEATQEDPAFALAYARLSEAYGALGYDGKAKDAADMALSRLLRTVDAVTPADRAFVRAAFAAAAREPQEAIDAYSEVFQADPLDSTNAYNLGLAYERAGHFNPAEIYYRKAIEVDRSFALAHLAVGRVRELSGRPEGSLEAFHHALALYVRMGSREGEASAQQHICNAHIGLREWDEALVACRHAAEIRNTIGDKRGFSASLASESYIHQVQGRLPEALSASRRALSLSREIGYARGIALNLADIGSILSDQGEHHDALLSYREASGACREIGDMWCEALCLDASARIEILLGDLDAAGRDLSASEALHREASNEQGIAQTTSDKALLVLARGDPAGAEQILASALVLWQALQHPEGISETRYRQSVVALQEERHAEAIQLATAALADYERAKDKLNAARCRLVVGKALARSGDFNRAARVIDEALAFAESIGNTALLEELRTVRSGLPASLTE